MFLTLVSNGHSCSDERLLPVLKVVMEMVIMEKIFSHMYEPVNKAAVLTAWWWSPGWDGGSLFELDEVLVTVLF